MTLSDVLPYALGAVQVGFGLLVHELRESRQRMGERIGELEKDAKSARDTIARLETRANHFEIAIDKIGASLVAIEHKTSIIAEKLSAATGRHSSPSHQHMPAVKPPRPGDR
jgi:hypothetical protein